MAIALVASFAVIPTSAAYTGDKNIYIQSDFWYVHYWRVVDVWCESTDPHWCWARVDDPDGNVYDYYYDSQMTMMAVAVATGAQQLTGIAAQEYIGSGAYGGQSK